MDVTMKVQGIKEIEKLFSELPRGIKQPTTWRKFWKKNTEPMRQAAEDLAPIADKNHIRKSKSGDKVIARGTLKNSIQFFTTRKTRKYLGGYIGPRVKGVFKGARSGFYGPFVEYGGQVKHWGKANSYEGKKFMEPAFKSKKSTVISSGYKDAEEIFAKETKRWAKRTEKYGVLGR